jgi:hypothetical protein
VIFEYGPLDTIHPVECEQVEKALAERGIDPADIEQYWFWRPDHDYRASFRLRSGRRVLAKGQADQEGQRFTIHFAPMVARYLALRTNAVQLEHGSEAPQRLPASLR